MPSNQGLSVLSPRLLSRTDHEDSGGVDRGHAPSAHRLFGSVDVGAVEHRSSGVPPTTPHTSASPDRTRNYEVANVDLNCAVKLSAFLHPLRTHRLPVLRCDWLDDYLHAQPLDRCGRRRSKATSPNFRRGLKPGNWQREYPPTPPSPAEVVAILAQGSKTCPAHIRDRALWGVVWRSGLRISEALALEPADLSREHNSVVVKCGKGGKRRISGIDEVGFELLDPWLAIRGRYPFGPLFCITEGSTKGGPVAPSSVRARLHEWTAAAGVTHRVAPHQLRHAHACDLAREGVPVQHVSRQLGHANLAITTTYLQGIAPTEMLGVIAARPRPVELAQEATS